MARFFQAQPVELVEDIIFQPNLELASAALMKKDADITEQLDELDLFNNLPISFWKDADQDTVNQIRDEYEQRVDDVVNQMMEGDLTNTVNSRRLINQIRRDIERDYESGRIYQVQETAKNREKFLQKLEQLNPVDREAYSKAFEKYLQENPGGSANRIFEAPEVFETEDLWNDYMSSDTWKGIEAEVGSTITQTPSGRWIHQNGTTVSEKTAERIMKGFESYAMSRPNLLGRARAGSEYFGEDNWLDEEGNIRGVDDAEGMLGTIARRGAEALKYRNVQTTQQITHNPYELAKYNSDLAMDTWKEQRRIQAEEAKNSPQPGSVGIARDASFFLNYTPEGKKITQEYHATRNNFLTNHMTDAQKEEYVNNPSSQQRLLQATEDKIRNNPTLAPLLQSLDDSYDATRYAGYQHIQRVTGGDPEVLNKVMTYYDSAEFVGAMLLQPGYMNFGKGQNGNQFFVGVNKTLQKPENIVGMVYSVPGPHQGWTISKIEPITNSGLPMDLILHPNSPSQVRGSMMDFDVIIVDPNNPANEHKVPAEFFAPNHSFGIH